MKNVLQIENLSISFRTDEGTFNMVKNLSYSVKEGEIVGIVGESGCGKTISSLCTMGLLPSNAIIDNGRVILNEEDDLLTFSEKKMTDIRGKKVSMIFQEPMKALDPVFTIGEQMVETVLCHNKGMKKKEARELSLEMLKKVEIANPEHVLKCYPHQLSGGMKQRIIIGMALICEPMLLIADGAAGGSLLPYLSHIPSWALIPLVYVLFIAYDYILLLFQYFYLGTVRPRL